MLASHRVGLPASPLWLALLLTVTGSAHAEDSGCNPESLPSARSAAKVSPNLSPNLSPDLSPNLSPNVSTNVTIKLPASSSANTTDDVRLNACIRDALALSKAGKYAEAVALADGIERAAPRSVAAHQARAQIEWDGLNWVAALHAYDRTIALAPQNTEAHEGRLLVLSKMNLPSQALGEAATLPHISSAVLQRLHEDETALAIRWSEKVYYAKPGEQFPVLDRAIAMAESNLKRFPGSVRSRLDYVRALNNRQRSADAIAAYEQLQRDGIVIPAYVHQSAGSAYLAMKRPEQAAVAFRAALAGDPDDVNANLGLFYTLIDLSDFPAAQRHIDAYAAHNNLPADKFDAAMAAIMERAFENRLDLAQARLQTLSDEAPSSEPLRLAEAKIALWRGWPRQAHEQARQVTLREVDDLHANILLADTDAVLGDYASASARLAKLHALVPQDPDVNNLLRAAEVRAMREIAFTFNGTRSKENLGAGHGVVADLRAFGHPIRQQARPFVHTYFERATSDSATADYRRLGAGVDYVIPRAGNLRVELQQEFFHRAKTSVQFSAQAELNDFWRISALVDTNSIEIPLRARYDDIGGNEVQLGAAYRASERLSFGATVTRLHMSDGNLRHAIGVQARANLIEGPYYKGTLEAAFSATRNSLADAAYFNPSSAHTTELAWVSEWMNYQRYNRSFGQQLTVSVGRTAEAGFATGTIGAVYYTQRVSFSDTLALSYGVGAVRRLYSGSFSSGPEANLSVNWKF